MYVIFNTFLICDLPVNLPVIFTDFVLFILVNFSREIVDRTVILSVIDPLLDEVGYSLIFT